MKIIVTGGAGFIGSHLVEALVKSGFQVIVLDNFSTGREANLAAFRDKIKLLQCDISRPDIWMNEFINADWVFHLAALADIVPSIKNPEDYFRANVDGTFNVLQAARSGNVKRFVYSASSSCYGTPDTFPTKEDSEIRPMYPYALTKRIGEELVMHWALLFKLPALSLRFFNVYGTRSRTSGTYGAVFGVFLAQKLANQPLTIVGDGSQKRDFTYVTDIVEALISAASSDKVGKIYNVGSGKTVSINRLVELLGSTSINIPKRPGEPDCTFADIAKIKADLGWEPKVPIEIGVQKVLENIEYWREAPVWDKNSIEFVTIDWFKYLS